MDFSDLGGTPVEEQKEKKSIDFSDLGATLVEEKKDIITKLTSDMSNEDLVKNLQIKPEDLGEYYSTKPDSKAMSYGKGVEQGATLSTYDELAGLMSGAGRVVGLTDAGGPLKDLGFTSPTLDPEELLKAYRQTRDVERNKISMAKESHPNYYLGGELTGGFLTAPVIPGATLAKGASLGQKVLSGAKIGAGFGAATGIGTSTADLTKGDIWGLGEDILTGTGTGFFVGGGIPVVGAAIKGGAKLAGEFIPESAKQAFEKGTQGIKLTKDYLEKVNRQGIKTGEEIAEPIIQKQAAQKVALAEEHSKNINFVSNQLENAENEFLKKNTLEEESLISGNLQKSKQIEKQKLGLADRIQNRLSEVENVLKKEYDKIDNQLTEQNFQLDTKPIVENFKKQLIDSGITDSKTIESLTKDLDLYAQNSSSKGFMNLKRTLNKMFDNSNPSIKGAAKTGYKQLRELQFSELSKTDKNLAETIANTNKRWAAKYDLEDRLTKISESDSILGKTLKAIESEEGYTAEHLAKQRVLRETLPVFDPEQSSNIIQEMEEMAKQTLASKNFKPEINKQLPPEILELRSNLEAAKEVAKKAKIPEYTNYELYKKQQALKALKAAEPEQLNIPVNEKIPQLESELQQALEYKQPEYTNLDLHTKERELEALKSSKPLRTTSPTNPEIERLQSLMDQSKSKGAGNIAGLERFNLSTPEKIQDEMRDLIEEMSRGTNKMGTQRRLDDLFKYIEQSQSPEVAKSIKEKMIQVAKDKALAKLSQSGTEVQLDSKFWNLIGGKAIGKTIQGANLAGQVVGKFSRPSPQMVERATTPAKEFLKDGAVQLSEASPEQMQDLANKMSDIGAKGYSDVLNKVATTKNSVSRNAMIFGLMQQPEFRKNFNSVTGKEENEESGK